MARYHGVTTETVKRLFVDAGAVYLNYDETDERLLGATRGGNTFTIEQDVREIELDGARGPVKGLRRIIEVRAQIVANLLELTADNLKIALAGSTMEDYPDELEKTHDKITRKHTIEDSDYLKNVALVGEISGSQEPVICIVKNALADGNFSVNTADKDEAGLEITFTGHFDPENLDEEPWEIRFPKIGSGGGS